MLPSWLLATGGPWSSSLTRLILGPRSLIFSNLSRANLLPSHSFRAWIRENEFFKEEDRLDRIIFFFLFFFCSFLFFCFSFLFFFFFFFFDFFPFPFLSLKPSSRLRMSGSWLKRCSEQLLIEDEELSAPHSSSGAIPANCNQTVNKCDSAFASDSGNLSGIYSSVV